VVECKKLYLEPWCFSAQEADFWFCIMPMRWISRWLIERVLMQVGFPERAKTLAKRLFGAGAGIGLINSCIAGQLSKSESKNPGVV
jgi:hypothetical protein